MTLDVQTTVGELVKERPGRSRVLEKLQIDYCCGGTVSLADACAQRELDPQAVLQQIHESDAQPAAGEAKLVDADAMSLTDLANHIQQTHHEYMKGELPQLQAMTQKVHEVHGESDPRLAEVCQAFAALHQELSSHLMKEEQVLFPMIRQLESSTGAPAFPCGSVANPIQQMELEHDNAGNALAVMRESTDGYQPPEWACNTYRVMLDRLKQLEWDLHQHIHKENNVLFPKAILLEAKRGRH